MMSLSHSFGRLTLFSLLKVKFDCKKIISTSITSIINNNYNIPDGRFNFKSNNIKTATRRLVCHYLLMQSRHTDFEIKITQYSEMNNQKRRKKTITNICILNYHTERSGFTHFFLTLTPFVEECKIKAERMVAFWNSGEK